MARITRKEFTSSGSWVCPAGVTNVVVMACGGGGGGDGDGDDGGGGGSNMVFHCLDVVPNTSYTITVGSGGNGGSITGSGATAGGTTSFGSLVSWIGGRAGSTTGGDPAGMTISSLFNNDNNHSGGDENADGPVAYPGGGYSGGASYAEAGGGGAGGRGDGGDGGNLAAGSSAAANTGAGGGGGWIGFVGGAGGSGYLEIIWSE